MDSLQARIDSFRKSKRVKNPKKSSSTTTLKWQHPSSFLASPETLAEAGFYYDPTYDDPDNVTCFNCEKQLAGWEEDDDPYIIHWNKCAQSCCWAVVQCGLKVDMDRSGRFVFPDKTRLPTHKSMERARLETFSFGKGWVHDKTRNHGANSKSMARAGFAYTPQESADDLATCMYCNVSLSGWDEDDDPMEEHRKRASKSDTTCPFFEHAQSKPPSTKTPSRSTSKPSRTMSRTKQRDILVITDDESEDSRQPRSTQDSTNKTPAKSHSKSRTSSAKIPNSNSRSTSRSGLKGVTEEVEDAEDAIEAPPTVKKKKTRSKSVVKAEVPTQSDVEKEVVKPAEAPRTVKSKGRATRSKSVARTEATVQSDGEVTRTVRKTTRSRARSKAPAEVDEEEPIRKSSRSKSRVITNANEEGIAPSRKGSNAKVVEPESDKPEVVDPKPSRKTTTHKRTLSRTMPEFESNAEQIITVAPTTKPPTRSKHPSVNPEPKDLFNEDIVIVGEYVPPPTSPPPAEPSTISEPSSPFVLKRITDKVAVLPSGQSNGSEVALAAPLEKEAEKEKRKPGRPRKAKAKVKAISGERSKQVNKVVEISSDEEEVKKNEHLSTETKTRMETIEPMETTNLPALPAVDGFKHISENTQPLENTMVDVSMHDAEPGTQETVADAEKGAEQELQAKSTSEPDNFPVLPQSIFQTPDATLPETQPTTLIVDATAGAAVAEPLYLPPLSRLPFMPLQTLSEAELEMTVEEWIRYQIEVEQDRFKRDGERELERFKKRAEEVRNVIEGL